MKTLSIFGIIFLCFLTSACGKKQQEEEAVYSSSYKVIPVKDGATIRGKVKTDPSGNFLSVIETQKDQDVCGKSHPNPGKPNSDGALPNCIVGIEHITEGKDFAKHEYALDQRGCDFQPHVQIARIGSPIVVSNSDKALHNYHITRNGETLINEAQPEGAPAREVELKQKGLHVVTCDVHPWMRGYIWMADHPYYTLTDASGAFALSDVPPGKYKLTLWRDNWSAEEVKNAKGVIDSYKWGKDIVKEQEITVEAGKDVVVDFTLP
ncbi:MAG: carboxypeptidase regulatory-like domain-containing protein [Bacteroidota bacterium]|nr:carboxypeptidase regulatory-like domain-containing protein [Bacteroidota bacterium]